MANGLLSRDESKLLEDFRREYDSESSILRYSNGTAGCGITYLLDHEYGELYLKVIKEYLPASVTGQGLRIWEFGCGAGMNLLHLFLMLESLGIAVDAAYGSDFSPVLIRAAKREAETMLTAQQRKKVHFFLARNEALLEDAAAAQQHSEEALAGSLHLVLGVNTMRYGHRLGNADACAGGIYRLLAPGGVCIMIDMNRGFPAFRSRFRDLLTKEKAAYRLPSLDQYAEPFLTAGFSVLEKRNFCWIPHSAGRRLLVAMRTLAPLLQALAPDRSMRSLVISQKQTA